MNSQDENEKINPNLIWTSQKDKNEADDSNNDKVDLKSEISYEKYGKSKNFIPKSHLNKNTQNKNESQNYDFNFLANYFGNKKYSNHICCYFESTNKYLKNLNDYINLYNNLNHSKNFIPTKPQNDNTDNNLNENKSIASASTDKSKTDLDENNNNLYIINNININFNQNTIKDNCDNKYYSKQNIYNDNRNNDDYLLKFSLLNQTQNFTPINNNIYNNNNCFRKLNSQNWSHFNPANPSNNNKINFVNKFNGDNIYPVLNEPNINNPPFYPSNFNKQNSNFNKNLNNGPNNKNITTSDNNNSSFNIKSDNSSSSSNEEEDKNKKEQDDYLVRMFGRTGWICFLCNNFNYETRYKCNRCGLQKRPKKLEINNKKELFVKCNKNGDWLCDECQNLNYSFRKVCNRCKAPKPNENKNIVLSVPNNLVNNSLSVNKNLNMFNLGLPGLNL